jgi:long-chain acyl-CoA synthetase
VGKRPDPEAAKILDDEGRELPTGQPGTIYMRLADQGGFEYFKDSAKTDSGRRDGYFTMGDVGYFDEDGYLFLTGRSAETIIVGGVNIYPQEIDNELIKHPAVADSCTVGVPHEEYGEEVRAVIELAPGYAPTETLKDEILAYARTAVAKYKIPRGVDFVPRLPRSEAGKIQRNKVRAPYWEGRTRAI